MASVQDIAGKTRSIGGNPAKKIAAPTAATADPLAGQKGPLSGGPLSKQADGTYELVGNEWKKVADPQGNLVGDALEIAKRKNGTSGAGQGPVANDPFSDAVGAAVGNPGFFEGGGPALGILAGSGLGAAIGGPALGAAGGGAAGALAANAAKKIGSTPAQAQASTKLQLDPNAAAAAKGKSLSDQVLGIAQDDKNYADTNVTPLLAQQRAAAAAAGQSDAEMLRQQTLARDNAAARERALVGEQRSNAQNYNSQGTQLYNDYSAGQGALNQQDQANLSRYMGETDPLMTQLTARGSDPNDVAAQQAALQRATGIANGSLNYTAAQASSNAGDVARQNQSFGKLDAIGGGSLDYDAQLWASNPEDEQRQLDAYTNFDRIGGGKLDYVSEGGKAFADAKDLENQRNAYRDIQNEVASGGAKQSESYDLIKSRTGVEPTAKEGLLYELARRQQASQEKSSRDAVAERQASQGIRSGAAANAAARSSSQQNSENALLSALAANAGAVDRSTQYTGMMADQANAMRGAQQNALGLQGNMSTTMRGQSFDEAFKRGTAKDVASANNQGTQLAGYQLAGNQSNQIRNSNDNVGLTNAGFTNQARANNQSTRLTGNVQAANVATAMRNASDAMSTFNTGQTNTARANNQATQFGGAQLQANQSNQIRSANDAMSQFQDTYASNEATRVGNLAGQRATQGLATTSQVGARNDTTYDAGKGMLDTNYGRDKDTIGLDMGTVSPQYGRDSDVAAMTGANGQRAFDRTGTMVGTAATAAATNAGANANLVAALKFGRGQQIDEEDRLALSNGH